MNKINYQKELEKELERVLASGRTPRLLLHSCCAPCSSYVLEYLRDKFEITVLYYNPNITEREEYEKRCAELKRLAGRMNEETSDGILVEEGAYEPQLFFEAAKGLEKVPEGGERCFRCYELRLRETARIAAERGFDYFTTTLTISPLKNADKLNEIGTRLAEEYLAAPERFRLYAMEEYLDFVADVIERIRPEVCLERFVNQSPDEYLVAPKWGVKNFEFVAKLDRRLEERDTWQGKLRGAPRPGGVF